MATLHETAYPRLKSDPSAKELEEIYAPTAAELRFVRKITTQPTTQLAVLIHLKLFQRLGYFVTLASVPERISQFIAQATGRRRSLSSAELKHYDSSGGKRAHMAHLRDYLKAVSYTHLAMSAARELRSSNWEMRPASKPILASL